MITHFKRPRKKTELILVDKNCPICNCQLFQKRTEFLDKKTIIFEEISCVECKKFREEPKISTTEIPGWGYPLEHWGF